MSHRDLAERVRGFALGHADTLSGEDILILGWATGIIARVPVEHVEEDGDSPEDIHAAAQAVIDQHTSHRFHPVDASTNGHEEDQSR